MPRRLTVECAQGHREEIIIGTEERIPRCMVIMSTNDGGRACCRKREIVWDEPGSQGAPGFRVKGLTKRF